MNTRQNQKSKTVQGPLIVIAMAALMTSALPTTAGAQELPQMDRQKSIQCSVDDEGRQVRIQCDEQRRRCLVASPFVLRDGQPTGRRAEETRHCEISNPRLYEERRDQGYEMVRARLDSPPGYRRDRRGRLVQDSFDLRRRAYLGFYDGIQFGELGQGSWPPGHGLTFEIGGISDRYDSGERRRRRTRFLEARFMMNPVELQAQLFRTDSVRGSDDPGFWIALPFGDLRLDVPLQIGVGAILGRLDYRQLDGDRGRLMLADILGIHTNWEFFQGTQLEDYALLRVGIGTGLRQLSTIDAMPLYLYPEAGLEMAWTLGERGLTELGLDARVRWAAELGSGQNWREIRGAAYWEQILFIVSDQPLALFVQPEARHDQFDFADAHGWDLRLLVGARLSGFVKPRQETEEVNQPATPRRDPGRVY